MDRELVLRAKQGDHGAFTSIVHAVTRQFHGIAFAMLRDAHLTDDAVQAALISIWRDLPRLRDAARFDGWSKRILINACYAELRRRRRIDHEISGDTHPVLESGTGAVTVTYGLDSVLDRDQLERGFLHLSAEQRAVMVLHFLLDMKPEQAAETLGIPLGTYKSRVHRATRSMRAGLDADAREAAERNASPEVAG